MTGISVQFSSRRLHVTSSAESEFLREHRYWRSPVELVLSPALRAVLPRSASLTADAQSLPFADASFDAAVCQFGLMFVPDKAAAFRGAARVLTTGGHFVFNVWAKSSHNSFGRIANEVITRFFPTDPPTFYQVPFGLDDQPLIRRLLDDAGFEIEQEERLTLKACGNSVAEFAHGLVVGIPILLAIREHGSAEPEEIISALAE